jgi:soluble lytic murein transglycosylase-like protein
MLIRLAFIAIVLAVARGLPAGADPAPAPAVARTAAPAALGHLAPRPRAAAAVGRRCTTDRTVCIRRADYVADVCRAIEALARDNAIDEGFFARLLWRESLFDAAAVSPAGAEGIAQFMPGTARARGLADAFNPAEALAASARYLAELSRDYGNIGLAAAAYNGGEARVDRFLAAKDALPAETRAYVVAITGFPVEDWRDAPPDAVPLSLGEGSFQ